MRLVLALSPAQLPGLGQLPLYTELQSLIQQHQLSAFAPSLTRDWSLGALPGSPDSARPSAGSNAQMQMSPLQTGMAGPGGAGGAAAAGGVVGGTAGVPALSLGASANASKMDSGS